MRGAMKSSPVIAFIACGIIAFAGSALGAGKPAGAMCHVSRSCQSHLCVRLQPADKFGVCCEPETCASLGAQCGMIDNGCGTQINCRECDPGSFCDQNTCMTTTTTTTSTSTTTTSTSTTSTTLGCIPESQNCDPASPNCCNGGECITIESGSVCIMPCVPAGQSCAIGQCCNGLACISTPNGPICQSIIG